MKLREEAHIYFSSLKVTLKTHSGATQSHLYKLRSLSDGYTSVVAALLKKKKKPALSCLYYWRPPGEAALRRLP